jgi:hypothetical protein
MHRMDLRGYSVGEEVVDEAPVGQEAPAATEPPEPPRRRIRLEPAAPEPDVQEMVDDSAARFAAMNERLGLSMWGLKVFEREDIARYDPAQWRERLAQARTIDLSGIDERELASSASGPGLVAAVCVRDHWDEMMQEERDWCVESVCAEVMETANVWNEMARMQRYSMSADRSCARVVSLLLGKPLSPDRRSLVETAFASALTHPTEEVRWYAIWGIAYQLWAIDRTLTLRCVNALAAEATLIDQARDDQDGTDYDERRGTGDITAEAAIRIRERFWTDGGIPPDSYERMEVDDWFGAEANGQALAILGEIPTDQIAISAFARGAATLARWWTAREDERRGRRAGREHRHEAETALSDFLQKFILRTTPEAARSILQPILDTVDRVPRDLHFFIRGLVIAEDRQANPQQFWFVWELFAERIRRAPWLHRLDDRYGTGQEVIAAILLAPGWKENARHWTSLEGHVHRLHALFESLPPSATALNDYLRFLYHVGEQSLPAAFVRVAQRLRVGNAQDMLKKGDTIFMLEVLLQRYVYGRPLELKRDTAIREAVLDLLDALVEGGSSAAFRMRDDFVTPASAN